METRPPRLVDGIVRTLTPPLAREEVIGDLWERYRSPATYLSDAAQILPFVICAQVRRNTNLAALGVIAIGIFGCLGGFLTETNLGDVPRWARAAMPTLAAVCGLLLRDAYRASADRCVLNALLDAATAAACIALTQAILFVFAAYGAFNEDWVLSMARLPMVFVAILSVFLYRFALGAGRDRQLEAAEGRISLDDLILNYRSFRRRVGWRNFSEILIGVGMIGISVQLLPQMEAREAAIGWSWQVGHLGFIAYLALRGGARDLAGAREFPALRAHYTAELKRQCTLRRFVWWWYALPLFVGIVIRTIVPGIASGEPLTIAMGSAAIVVLAVLLGELTRERSERFQDSIDLVGAIREGRNPQSPAFA